MRFFQSDLFFVTVGFVYSRWRSTVTDGVCRQIYLTRHFSHAIWTLNYMHITLHGSRRATQRVCVRASFHLHAIHDVCLSVRCLSLRVCPSPVSLHRLFLLFLTPLVLCPALHLHNVNSAEGNNRCVFAHWGVLHHGVIQSSHIRAVVGKLQYITRVRPDLMFATKCLSYKLTSPTLAVLTRAKKVLSCFQGTRELNLYLTILAKKPNDLNNTLKHVTGYSDADWAGDPVTRKITSCTLCYVDQFLLTSECRGQGTVALSSGESELYALGALSADLIFAQAILKEIGLSSPIHARADSNTARAVATKQRASRKMKHIHTRFFFIQDLVFRKLLTMS